MKSQNLESKKLDIISMVTTLTDTNLIDKLLNLLVPVKSTSEDIPQWQKNELDQRLKEHQEGTAVYEDWEKVKKQLFTKFDVK